MTLRTSGRPSLGFWSGRTGGVAWTGLSNLPSSGGAASRRSPARRTARSSRGPTGALPDDLFEFNQVDGLHVHRLSADTKVVGSAAVRNGADGFSVSPATYNTTFLGTISPRTTAGNGFQVNGRPLATARPPPAVPSPRAPTRPLSTAPPQEREDRHPGRRRPVDGRQGRSGVRRYQRLEVRHGSSDAVVTGDTIGCSPRSGIESVRPLPARWWTATQSMAPAPAS